MISIKGFPNPLGMQLEEITRENVDGIALWELGKRAAPIQVETVVDVNDGAAVKSTMEAYKVLQGTLVTVTDDAANAWTNVAVLDVELVFAHKIATASGGLSATKGWFLRARWTLQATNIP